MENKNLTIQSFDELKQKINKVIAEAENDSKKQNSAPSLEEIGLLKQFFKFQDRMAPDRPKETEAYTKKTSADQNETSIDNAGKADNYSVDNYRLILYNIVNAKWIDYYCDFLLLTFEETRKSKNKKDILIRKHLKKICENGLRKIAKSDSELLQFIEGESPFFATHSDEDRNRLCAETSDFISKIKKGNTRTDYYRGNSRTLASVIFIWMTLKTDEAIVNKWDKAITYILIQKCFAEQFSCDPTNKYKEEIPEGVYDQKFNKILAKNDFDSELLKRYTILYAWDKDKISNLEKEIINSNKQIEAYESSLQEANEEIRKLSADLNKAENDIQIKDRQRLQDAKQIEATEDRLDYEKNKIQLQYDEFAHNYISKVRKSLSLELEGIQDICEFVDPNTKEDIMTRLSRIEDKLDAFERGEN